MTTNGEIDQLSIGGEEAVELNCAFYGERYKEFGYSLRALDFSNRIGQSLRFNAIVDLLHLPKHRPFTILDVGCGFADFHEFLVGSGFQPEYTGIDVTPDIIRQARSIRGPDLELHIGGFLESQFPEPFEYVVCSGALNLKLSDSWAWIQQMVKKMTQEATLAVSFNLTSTYTEAAYRQERTYYADPGQVFTFCKSLAERVNIRHDYMPNDFCISLHLNPFN